MRTTLENSSHNWSRRRTPEKIEPSQILGAADLSACLGLAEGGSRTAEGAAPSKVFPLNTRLPSREYICCQRRPSLVNKALEFAARTVQTGVSLAASRPNLRLDWNSECNRKSSCLWVAERSPTFSLFVPGTKNGKILPQCGGVDQWRVSFYGAWALWRLVFL